MQFKQTKKLFYGKYQYKIVLVFSGAHLFRNAPGDVVADRIKNVKLETDVYSRKRWTIKTEEEFNNKTQTKWLNQFKNDTIINVNSKTKSKSKSISKN